MQLQVQASIMGVKKFSGNIDGRTFDYCRIIAATPMDESTGNALGMASTEYDFGGSVNFERFRGLQFPFEAALTVEMVVSGKSQKFKAIDFRPLKQGEKG
jgi:hypothetical protein